MAKRKTEKEEADIRNRIIVGESYKQINESTGFTYKAVKRIAIEGGLFEKMRENNATFKNNILRMRMKELAKNRYLETDAVLGEEIERKIRSGTHKVPLVNLVGKSQAYFDRFLKWKSQELVEVLKANGERVLSENRLIASKKGADKTRGVPSKEITSCVEKLYKDLLSQNIHMAEIKRKMKPLGYGCKKVEQMAATWGSPSRCDQSGRNNPMYGKAPHKKSGIGVKGWLTLGGKRIFFRSSLEMKIFLLLHAEGEVFSLSRHRIPYILDETERTYCPDYVIANTVYEIKPKALVETKENRAKFSAAEEYCKTRGLSFNIVTETTFNLTKLTEEDIMNLIKEGVLEIDDKNLNKLKRYL